jgi:hypothetical protein
VADEFTEQIRSLGPSPVKKIPFREKEMQTAGLTAVQKSGPKDQ